MTEEKLLYLSRRDVEALGVGMRELIDGLEAALAEKGKGAVEMPPKPGIHPRANAFIHAMPAYLPTLDAAGMKWVSGYPANRAKGLPYISGLFILNDPETGVPRAVMDATWITANRTGAATAVAARYLAREDSASAGIIACGVEGRTNLEALACLFDLQQVKAYDIVREHAERFAAEMGEALGLEVEVVDGPRAAVEGLDLVVTSGPILKNPEPVIEPGWLKAGGFACALDFDSYWKASALAEADILATDDKDQLRYYRETGYFRHTPEPHADLGAIICGRAPGRRSEGERAICLNLGLALEDVVTAQMLYDRARRNGIGVWLEL